MDAPPPPPHNVFRSFFQQDKTSVHDVFSSCSFIPRADFKTSLVMVSRYGYEIWRRSSRWSSQFWVKIHVFFQLLSTIRVNIVAKIMQSAYVSVIFHVKHKKIPLLAVLTWIQILGKIRYGGQDGDHCWWRHRPPAVPSSIKYTSSC